MSKRIKQPKPNEVQRADGAKQEHLVDVTAVANILSTPRDPARISVKAQAEIGDVLSVE